MNTQSLDLNKMGLTPLSEIEMQEIEGGSFWMAVLGAAVGALIGLAVAGPVGAVCGAIVGGWGGANI